MDSKKNQWILEKVESKKNLDCKCEEEGITPFWSYHETQLFTEKVIIQETLTEKRKKEVNQRKHGWQHHSVEY